MDITPIISASRQVINAYGNGGFRIAGQAYTGSVLVFPERTLPWGARAMADLSEMSFAELRAARPTVDLLLLGCGSKAEALPKALEDDLSEAGIVAECMDTGAACRTYNILLAEERRVAAALIAVK